MAYLCFVVAVPDARELRFNDRTHPAFGEAVRRAAAQGVKVLALGCTVESDGFEIVTHIPVRLSAEEGG